MAVYTEDVHSEVKGGIGLITLNRPKALNALSLAMVRELMDVLVRWQKDDQVVAVAIRGSNKEGVFGAFCAGGDIRFLHAAGTVGNPELEDFFTEEYALNHLIHHFGKPYIAFMDGIVMGGGMGISQGGTMRIVTERTKMAMPETAIGLFPDVGGGYFLSRCPGHVGEYLGLTGQMIGAADALAYKLADGYLPSDQQAAVWIGLAGGNFANAKAVEAFVASHLVAAPPRQSPADAEIDQYFGKADVHAIIQALEAGGSDFAKTTAETLRKRSPLMLFVVLEQIRRARLQTLADDLRMERDMVRHCFYLRPNGKSETLEGIRALAVDKDHHPQWSPARIEDVDLAEVAQMFASPWPAVAHPLKDLG